MTGRAVPAGRRVGAQRTGPWRSPMPAASQPWRRLPAAAFAPATRHPLADDGVSEGLRRRADEIEEAFAAIEPSLRALAPAQFADGFPERASAELSARLGFALPVDELATTWLAPLDMARLYARLVLRTFCRLVERAFDRSLAEQSDGESAETLIHRWGFHAVDIAPCADGRLSGVVDYILRVPPAVVVSRRSSAGAMFDMDEALRRWETVELRRWREGRPNSADAPTRFLKVGVYHFSSADPERAGCAAHGSDRLRASRALLERLDAFATAIRHTQCCDAAVGTLLIGVDTDTDAICVHVPDAMGRMAPERFVDNGALYETTRERSREGAKDAIRHAVAACAGVSVDDAPSEGMRWFCGYLLKNNIGQIDAVRSRYGDAYAELGHTERLVVVGDPVDDVQLRNLAFQAQMNTVEEGASDLDIGVTILRGVRATRGLDVPVLVHFRYDPRIPGSDERARLRARRLQNAIETRYARQDGGGRLHVEAVIRAGDGSALIPIGRENAPGEFAP